MNGHQRKIIIIAPTIQQADDFYKVTEGMYDRIPTRVGFLSDPLYVLRGLRDAIIFILPCQYKIPDEIYFRKNENDCIIVSDWRL